MSINGIGNSAASWAQFVKLTQAARDRNGGFAGEMAKVGGAVNPQKGVDAVSFKRVADVYSGKQQAAPVEAAASLPALSLLGELNRSRVVGGKFDTYA